MAILRTYSKAGLALLSAAGSILVLVPISVEMFHQHGPGSAGMINRLFVTCFPAAILLSLAGLAMRLVSLSVTMRSKQWKDSAIYLLLAGAAALPVSLIVLFGLSIAAGFANLSG